MKAWIAINGLEGFLSDGGIFTPLGILHNTPNNKDLLNGDIRPVIAQIAIGGHYNRPLNANVEVFRYSEFSAVCAALRTYQAQPVNASGQMLPVILNRVNGQVNTVRNYFINLSWSRKGIGFALKGDGSDVAKVRPADFQKAQTYFAGWATLTGKKAPKIEVIG